MAEPSAREQRFWSKVDPTGFCWNWRFPNQQGYGSFRIGPRSSPAHRVAYEWLVAPIPSGLVLDHLCRNRACVNPDHLEPVTQAENLRRGAGNGGSLRSHCKRGHEYTPESTYIDRRGKSLCKICRRQLEREKYVPIVRDPKRSVIAGKIAMHTRWHVNRGTRSDNCEFCAA